jgi:hypothetical protein
MRVKLDEMFGASLAAALRALGHDVDTVADEGLRGHDDDTVWGAAQGADRFFVTWARPARRRRRRGLSRFTDARRLFASAGDERRDVPIE